MAVEAVAVDSTRRRAVYLWEEEMPTRQEKERKRMSW
jgi:hypothetical protein